MNSIIKSAPEFKEALFAIWEKAQEYDIHFTPEYEMLLAVFQQAKKTEQQLAVLTNGEFRALGKLGIDITNLSHPKHDLKEDAKLFSALIEHSPSLEELAERFNTITSDKYEKTAKFKPHHFEFYKSQLEQGEKQPFPKWYFTIALEVLCELGIKPDTVISPPLVVEHWLRLNKKATMDETWKTFTQQFKHLGKSALCLNSIKAALVSDDLAKMAQHSQSSPPPSLAIEQWLKRWKSQNLKASLKAAQRDFGKEFPAFKDNTFLLNIIERNFQ